MKTKTCNTCIKLTNRRCGYWDVDKNKLPKGWYCHLHQPRLKYIMKKQLSMKKLYMLAGDFLMERYDTMGKTAKIIKKKELPYLKEFLDYIWKHK